MLFNSSQFAIFFVIVCVIYWALARFVTARTVFLVLASYFFYASWNWRFLALLIGISLADYLAVITLDRVKSTRGRKLVLTLTVVVHLSVLGFWKYTNFLIDNLNPLVTWFGRDAIEHLSIVLPVGISFFTFQGLSYVIDVYRRECPAVYSPLRFLLYIAYFPHLVAGPIIRAKYLLLQMDRPFRLSEEDLGRGLFMMLGGLLKKIVIADYLAANIVDRVFDLPEHFTSLEVLIAIYGYALQIYGDFSGYTDIAIGASLLLGYHLAPNFNLPYRATSLQDFWRRWHISLSSWLRDYLYIPLGGSRRGKLRTYVNLLLTMLLGGLWHGASLNFVIWGGFHGLGLAGERLLSEAAGKLGWRSRAAAERRWWNLLRGVVTFHLVAALWVFFRAGDFPFAIGMFRQLLAFVPGAQNITLPIAGIVVAGFALHLCPTGWHERARVLFTRAPAVLQAGTVIGVLYVLRALSAGAPAPFIYFQF